MVSRPSLPLCAGKHGQTSLARGTLTSKHPMISTEQSATESDFEIGRGDAAAAFKIKRNGTTLLVWPFTI